MSRISHRSSIMSSHTHGRRRSRHEARHPRRFLRLLDVSAQRVAADDRDIIAANPRILGAGGKLSQAVHALRGNVIYLRGNHDIGMTQGDLNRLPLGDNHITLVDDDVIVDKSGIVLTHGHLFTMFNAPDPRYPGEVPVGHFVTRAIAHMLENTLAPTRRLRTSPTKARRTASTSRRSSPRSWRRSQGRRSPTSCSITSRRDAASPRRRRSYPFKALRPLLS